MKLKTRSDFLDDLMPHTEEEPKLNRIWVTDFNEEAAAKFACQVLDESDKDSAKPIIIYIDSNGGEVDALSTMVSVMDSIPNPCVTVAMGKAISCGAMLLAHGNIRCVAPHARVMVHEVSAGAHGNVNDMINDAKEGERINRYWMQQLARDCNKDVNKFTEMFSNTRREMWFTATEAVAFGIADRIGIPTVKPQLQQQYEISLLESKPRPTLEAATPPKAVEKPKAHKKKSPKKPTTKRKKK